MKRIAFTFAGRQDRMELQTSFLINLLDKNLIDELHIWNFARKQEDDVYIKSSFNNNTRIKVYDGLIKNDGEVAGYTLYKQAYLFYQDESFKDTLFIKLDDDVIFCDTAMFNDFADFAENSKDLDLVSANVINNPHTSAFQYQSGYFEDLDFEIEYPEFYCPPIITQDMWAKEPLWLSGDKPKRLHRYFVENNEKIINKARSAEKNSYNLIPKGHRFAINFVAFKQGYINLIAKAYSDGHLDDEKIITEIIPTMYSKETKKFVYERLIVAHISYWPQDKLGLNVKEIIDLYKTVKSLS
jgi:hypothetical protein